MQRERVEDQYPWTWEAPLAVACGMVVVLVVTCQVARSWANWFAGAGWHWPPLGQLFGSTVGVLAGDASAGLSGVHQVADPTTLGAWLGVLIAANLAACAMFTVLAWRRWGPGRMRGMASIDDAHRLLGVDRLWRVRHVVRPDLYPSPSRVSTRPLVPRGLIDQRSSSRRGRR